MNAFVNAVQNTPTMGLTANGAVTYTSSLDKCVDLFFLIGASRKDPSKVIPAFAAAFGEDREMAARILLWSRDARGGAGEREVFRTIVRTFACDPSFSRIASKLVDAVPTYGRWDDMMVFMGTPYEDRAIEVIGKAIAAGDGLAAKWMPRNGKEAVTIRTKLRYTPKRWRKTLVTLSNTVEQKMCAQKWDEINYSHVPSVAAKSYQAAFSKHDPAGYGEYRAKLVKALNGEKVDVKVNASVLFPHEVVRNLRGSVGDQVVNMAQWEALPNFLGDAGGIVPVVDVSGSMGCVVGGTTTALDVSVGIGLYLADKQKGPFKDMFITFSESSKIEILRGNIMQKIQQMNSSKWGMSTNLQSAFAEILRVAKQNDVPAAEMPKYLLIISDMEFNCVRDITNQEAMRRQFEVAGYELPLVVFWNVNGRLGNSPATKNMKNVALVSGFSPSICKAILAADVDSFTPAGIMKKTVMDERYNIFA